MGSQLVVALGNPGLEYHHTRHNIAWDLLDHLSDTRTLMYKEKFKGLYSEKVINGEKQYFLRPQTYMNLSGESVIALMNFFKISLDQILVIHDELDLPYGTLAFKMGGGLAGHNGLKSIAQHCGGQQFQRLRLGIGRPVHGSVSNWVLSKYDSEQESRFEDYMELAGKALAAYIHHGPQVAARQFSRQSIF